MEERKKERKNKKWLYAVVLIITFLFGYQIALNRAVIKYDVYKFTNGNVDLIKKTFGSPKDRIKENQILVMRDKIEIVVADAGWSSYQPTGSMEPTLSDTANGLYLKPKGPKDIQIGDIIVYQEDTIKQPIVHRVVDIKEDEYGNIQYIVQGDANSEPDSKPVEFEQVIRVLIGIIY